jgi:hypothetical protein
LKGFYGPDSFASVMHARWSNHGGNGARIVACALATTVGLAAIPARAAPLPLMRVKQPKVTPAAAEAERLPVQERARAMAEAGDPMSAGIEYDNAAAQWGDPVLFMDAADAYLSAAEQERDVETAQAGIERAHIALDILYFHLDSAADKDFRLVETADVPDLIARANESIEHGESLIDEIQQEARIAEAGSAEEGAAPAPKRKKKPGRIKIISGAALATVGGGLLVMGAVGLGLGAARQNDAEDPTVYGNDYDAVESKGKRANVIAGVGLAVGAVAAAAGAALIYLGVRDKKKAASDDKVVRVGPLFGHELGGVTVSGRF